jgi:hypothetical protein
MYLSRSQIDILSFLSETDKNHVRTYLNNSLSTPRVWLIGDNEVVDNITISWSLFVYLEDNGLIEQFPFYTDEEYKAYTLSEKGVKELRERGLLKCLPTTNEVREEKKEEEKIEESIVQEENKLDEFKKKITKNITHNSIIELANNDGFYSIIFSKDHEQLELFINSLFSAKSCKKANKKNRIVGYKVCSYCGDRYPVRIMKPSRTNCCRNRKECINKYTQDNESFRKNNNSK